MKQDTKFYNLDLQKEIEKHLRADNVSVTKMDLDNGWSLDINDDGYFYYSKQERDTDFTTALKTLAHLQEHPDLSTVKNLDWDLYPGNEAGSFDHLDNEQEDKEIEKLEADLWNQPTGTPPVNNTGDKSREGFTGGEWYAKEGQIYPIETGKTLALIPYYNEDNEEHKANAQLIAAAPELLAALKEITEMALQWSVKGLTPTIYKAEQAIRKATNQ